MTVDVQTELKGWIGQKVKTDFFKASNLSTFELGVAVKTYAKQLCPVKSGRSRASVSLQMYDRESGFNEGGGFAAATDKIGRPGDKQEARVGSAVPYYPGHEYGTATQDAQSSLRSALGLVQGRAYEVFERHGRAALRELT